MKKALYGAVSAAALLAPVVAQAAITEMVVSAERREEGIQTVPIAVSAFSPDTMENLGIDSAIDLGAAVPNLKTTQVTGGTSAIQLSMRGANVQIPGLNTSESPVGIYTDGVYRGRMSAANLEYLDVERIEVLRGPQGTLYGRNTLAGAINVVSRTPGDESWASAKVGYGSWETFEVGGSVGAPIKEGALAGSLAVQYGERNDGYIDNPTLGDRGAYENYAARAKLHYYGDDDIDITVSAFVESSESDGYNAIPYSTATQMPLVDFYTNLTPSDSLNDSDTDVWGFSADASLNISDSVTLRSITSYQDIEDSFAMDLSGAGFILVDSDAQMDQFTQEVQLLGSGESLDWIIGLFFMKEEGSQSYGVSDWPIIAGGPFVENTASDTTSIALFAEGTYAVTDRLSVTAGIRWTEDDKEFEYAVISASPDDFTLDESFVSVTPKIGVDFQLNDDILLYATASSGFQAGGFQTLTFGNSTNARLFYDPMNVISYEVGMKGDFLDNRLRINGNVFFAQYEDLQATVPLNFGFPQLNVGDVDVTGVELEVVAEPVDGLDIFLTAGYADDDIDSTLLASDIKLPALPETTARIGFNYERPMGNNNLAVKFGADHEYSDSYFAAIDNAVHVPSYNRTNAYIALGDQDDKWEVRLSGRNLTDEDDFVSGLGGLPEIRTILPPRSWMLTAKFNF